MSNCKMTIVRFTGWKPGARKIKFTMLLHEEGQLPLKVAKNIKDKVIGGNEVVELDFKNPETAEVIYQQAKLLGVECELISEMLESQRL